MPCKNVDTNHVLANFSAKTSFPEIFQWDLEQLKSIIILTLDNKKNLNLFIDSISEKLIYLKYYDSITQKIVYKKFYSCDDEKLLNQRIEYLIGSWELENSSKSNKQKTPARITFYNEFLCSKIFTEPPRLIDKEWKLTDDGKYLFFYNLNNFTSEIKKIQTLTDKKLVLLSYNENEKVFIKNAFIRVKN